MTDHIDTAAERAKLAALEGHTPGPWRQGKNNPDRVSKDGEYIANCNPTHQSHPRIESNARLIAAAPGLLALTDRLLDALDADRARSEKAEAERDEWMETARHHSKAESAFLGWLRGAGEHMRAFGVTICDDGSDDGEVLVAKVPKCAKAMAGRITDLEAERDQALAQMAAVRDEIDRLRKALTFYADVGKYVAPLTGGQGDLYFDCGARAMAALTGENQK